MWGAPWWGSPGVSLRLDVDGVAVFDVPDGFLFPVSSHCDGLHEVSHVVGGVHDLATLGVGPDSDVSYVVGVCHFLGDLDKFLRGRTVVKLVVGFCNPIASFKG